MIDFIKDKKEIWRRLKEEALLMLNTLFTGRTGVFGGDGIIYSEVKWLET